MPKFQQINRFKHLYYKGFSKMSKGTHSNATAFEISDDELSDSLNLEPISEGVLRTRFGYVSNGNEIADGPVYSGTAYITDTFNKIVTHCKDGIYIKGYTDAGWSKLDDGFEEGESNMVQAFNFVYFSDGVSKMQKITETTCADLDEKIVDELLMTGNNSKTTFTGSLAAPEIKTGTVEIKDNTETFTDNGDGTLTGDAGGSGTINYTTGAYSVTFNTAPGTGIGIYAGYTRYPETYKYLYFWKNRIWAAKGSRLYYSASGGDEFSLSAGGGFVDIYAQDGTDITGFAVFNDKLFIFKDYKIVSIEIIVNESTTYMVPAVVRETIGSCANKSIISTENNVFFLYRDKAGGYSIQSLGPEPNMIDQIRVEDVSQRVRNKLDAINSEYAHLACATFHNHGYYLCYAVGNSNDHAMKYDLQYLSLFPQEGYKANCFITLTNSNGSRSLAFCDSSEGYLQEFSSGYTDNGEKINCYLTTKQYHIIEYILSKRFRFIDIYLQDVIGDLDIEVLVDSISRDSLRYNVGGARGSAGIGLDVIGLTEIGLSTGNGTSEAEAFLMRISRGYAGRTIGFKMSNVNAGDKFSFLGCAVYLRKQTHRAFDQNLIFGGDV